LHSSLFGQLSSSVIPGEIGFQWLGEIAMPAMWALSTDRSVEQTMGCERGPQE
jgi:hypothetical protein